MLWEDTSDSTTLKKNELSPPQAGLVVSETHSVYFNLQAVNTMLCLQLCQHALRTSVSQGVLISLHSELNPKSHTCGADSLSFTSQRYTVVVGEIPTVKNSFVIELLGNLGQVLSCFYAAFPLGLTHVVIPRYLTQ